MSKEPLPNNVALGPKGLHSGNIIWNIKCCRHCGDEYKPTYCVPTHLLLDVEDCETILKNIRKEAAQQIQNKDLPKEIHKYWLQRERACTRMLELRKAWMDGRICNLKPIGYFPLEWEDTLDEICNTLEVAYMGLPAILDSDVVEYRDERVIPFHERKLRLAVDNTINPPDKTVTVVLWRDTLEDDNKNDNNSGQRNWNVERAFSSKDLAIAYIEKQERRNEYRIAWGYREILLDKSE